MRQTIATIETSAGTVELFRNQEGYWVLSPDTGKVGNVWDEALQSEIEALKLLQETAENRQGWAEA